MNILIKIKNIIDEFKATHILQENQRYNFNDLLELDAKLAGICGDNKMREGLVYYSYHIVWFIVNQLDPNFRFEYQVIDYTGNIDLIESNKVKGLSVSVKYISDTLPIYKQEIPLCVMDNKNNAITNNITSDDMDYGYQRAFVKSVAFNTGIGLLCWLDPEFVKNEIAKENKNQKSNTTIAPSGLAAKQIPLAKPTPTPTPTPNPIPTPTPTPSPAPTPNPIPTPIANPTPTNPLANKPTLKKLPVININPITPPTASPNPVITNPSPSQLKTNPIPTPIANPNPLPDNPEELAKALFDRCNESDEFSALVIDFMNANNIDDINAIPLENIKELLAN